MNDSQPTPRIEILLKAYADRTASPDEVRELFQLLETDTGAEALKRAVLQDLQSNGNGQPNPGDSGGFGEGAGDTVWSGIRRVLPVTPRRRIKRFVYLAAAISLAAGLIIFFSPAKPVPSGRLQAEVAVRMATTKTDVAPGTQKAVLILTGGEKIWLDSARNGTLREQGGTRILKPARGQLLYKSAGIPIGEALYNSVETPRGGEYQVQLPDGSKVWLNASSSLRFPTVFTGRDRRVELKGEAYFEVAKNAGRPFCVQVGRTEIKVLGTHFNVMAYANEGEFRTTLLEGRVDVTRSGRSKKLVPGKEAVVAAGADAIAVKPGNTQQATAWKNGLFRFHETGIRAIMRQLERWYDVDVEFRTEARDQDFTGVLSRTENLSTVLQTLELTGTVHFRILGRKVIVLE